MKGIMRFEKKGELSPRYIGPYEILEQVGEVAYKFCCHSVYLLCIRHFMF